MNCAGTKSTIDKREDSRYKIQDPKKKPMEKKTGIIQQK